MATSLQESPPMAKQKGVSVQIDEDVVKTARVVSALVDKPISALVSEILRPALERMEQEEFVKRTRAATRPPNPGKGKTGHPKRGKVRTDAEGGSE
jgi:hypothetical protein